MNRKELMDKLGQIDPTKDSEMNLLAEQVLRDARETSRSAVNVWLDLTNFEMSNRASDLLGLIEDVAVVPLMEVPSPPGSMQRVWMLQTLVAAELELRQKIVKKLDELMDDKNTVPIPFYVGSLEEPPVPRRVCDEAYVLMRQMMNLSENREQYYLNVDNFLNLSEKEKDGEIDKTRKSRTWTRWIQD